MGSRGGVLFTGPALGAFLIIAVLGSCAPRKAPVQVPPEFPFILDAQVDLVLGAEGLVRLDRVQVPGLANEVQASLAPRVASLSSLDSGPPLVLAALNRYGLALLQLSPDHGAFKLRNLPRPEFANRSVASLWPRNSSWLLELYRDPFVLPSQARSDQDPELLTLAPSGELRILPRLGGPGEDLFALFPGTKGRWFAEFRIEQSLGAKLRYASLGSPEPGSDGRPVALADLRKDLFEASLAPRPLSAAASTLRRAAQAIEAGPILIHALGAGGSDAFWLSSGRAEDAREASAWLGLGEDSALVVLRSGLGAWATKDGVRTFSLGPRLAGAEYGPVTGIFTGEGQARKVVVAAAWTLGQFPGVTASGLSLLALGLEP